jgi:hypothetical protein
MVPKIVFDMSEGRSLPPNLEKVEVRMILLPEMVLEMEPIPRGPVLHLNLSARPEVAPGEVALDLVRIYAAVNHLEMRHHGGWLVARERVVRGGRRRRCPPNRIAAEQPPTVLLNG